MHYVVRHPELPQFGDELPRALICFMITLSPLRLVRLRSRALDAAVVLAAVAGASTCGAALTLFLGAVRGSAAATLLFWLFGGGLALTVAALAAFVLEMLLAARGVRHLLDRSHAASLRTRQGHAYRREIEPADLDTDAGEGGDDGDVGHPDGSTS